MSNVTTKEITYQNYGKCVELSNGIVKVITTIDIGPRIINYSFIDGENIMFEDLDRKISHSGKAFEKFGGGTWYIYGGHRLWTSPEAMPRSYYPDNEPVRYEQITNGIRLLPAPQKWNQYVMEMEVILSPDSSDVTVNHKITNLAAWDVTLAPWALTVLSPGGKEVIPQPQKDTKLLGNRLLALWPYTKMNDDRVNWGNKYTTLVQKTDATCAFKFGINSEHGFALYFNHGDLFVKRFNPNPDGIYPDGGMNFETYTDKSFLEMETIGESTVLTPEASIWHTENWSLYKEECPSDEETVIEELVKKYV